MNLNLSQEISANKLPEFLYHPRTDVEKADLTRYEKTATEIFPHVTGAVNYIADAIVRLIDQCHRESRPCLLCFSAEADLAPVYAELVRRHRTEGVSFTDVLVFQACEFLPVAPTYVRNLMMSLDQSLLSKIDARRWQDIAYADKADKEGIRPEEFIHKYGHIDMALLGKEGLAAAAKGTRAVMEAAQVIMAAWGDESAETIYDVVEGSPAAGSPAALLQRSAATVVVDLGAASTLTRIARPWQVTLCKWDEKLVRAAVAWLCHTTGKPILRLTDKDYEANGLGSLTEHFGSAGQVNIAIFNNLQHTITGWPGGKPNADDSTRPERSMPYPKRVIVFSPHPDDDVISMGGTIHKLVGQGHDVHIAYETSGNIAVGDEEVTRYMHFIGGFKNMFATVADAPLNEKIDSINTFVANKQIGQGDNADILALKGLIRRGEARAACTFGGIPLDHVHFLDLPFYESGTIEKLPMTSRDVDIVRHLLNTVKPHQVFVAGDLADPHGTHRKCTDAVLAAIDEERRAKAQWIDDCRVWMYRGAWAEWAIEDIDMCVPMSPDELRRKRLSILKHQSQMESAPFLGNDERLFWQRAEDRNRATAHLYDSMGLASYEAMEAFAEYKFK